MRVYEVMRAKRALSLNMIRNLREKLDVPAEVLIQPGRGARRVRIHRRGTTFRCGLRKSA